MLWAAVPAQLAKENQKFVYGLIRQGARAREYVLAMQRLLDYGLIYKDIARMDGGGKLSYFLYNVHGEVVGTYKGGSGYPFYINGGLRQRIFVDKKIYIKQEGMVYEYKTFNW